MPVRLQRKALKNKVRAAHRKATLKRLLFKPLMKCVDIEEMRKSFERLKGTS